MSDQDPNRNAFEDALRAIADEVGRAVDRLSEIDLEQIARSTGADPEAVKRWVDGAGEWLRDQVEGATGATFSAHDARPGRPVAGEGAPAAVPGEEFLRGAGPHPLDVPTAEQGLALAALDSGRWTIEPGTRALAARGDGPGPSDALGLVRELSVRDWIGADGQITLAGRCALSRWLDAADRA